MIENESEFGEQQEVPHGFIFNDSFDSQFVLYKALSAMTDNPFHIKFKQDVILMGRERDDLVNLVVNSEETSKKLKEIEKLADNYNIKAVINAVSLGYPSKIRGILNRTRPFRSSITGSYVDIILPIGNKNIVFERCFLRAFERMVKIRIGGVFPDPFIKEVAKKERSRTQTAYNKLQNKGVTPIDHEAVVGLLTPVINHILLLHPDLKS